VSTLSNLGIDIATGTPEDVTEAIQADITTFREALAAAGLLRNQPTK